MTVKRRSSSRRTCNRRLILNFPCAGKLIRNLTFNARFSTLLDISIDGHRLCSLFPSPLPRCVFKQIREMKYLEYIFGASGQKWEREMILSRLINLAERSIASLENLGRKFRRCAELFPGLR